MKTVIGVYLGWIPPHGKEWEPLYRTIRCEGGYQSDRTQIYTEAVARYPGLKEPLDFHPNPLKLPFALDTRIPLNRPDYKYSAKLLDLPYPNLDIFEYIGRSGGLMSGDPFSICPIVAPNPDGKYTYESLLWKFDPQVRDLLDETTNLKAISSSNESTILTADDRVLGELLPHFTHLGDAISNIKVVRIAEQHYFLGRQVLISLDTPVNLSAKFRLEGATAEVLANA
jgi:hypothetical protein